MTTTKVERWRAGSNGYPTTIYHYREPGWRWTFCHLEPGPKWTHIKDVGKLGICQCCARRLEEKETRTQAETVFV